MGTDIIHNGNSESLSSNLFALGIVMIHTQSKEGLVIYSYIHFT